MKFSLKSKIYLIFRNPLTLRQAQGVRVWDFNNYQRVILFNLLIIFNLNIYADKIKIENNSEFDIYGGIYYHRLKHTQIFGLKNSAIRASDIISIPAKSTQIIERPERKWVYDREFVFSLNKEDLKPDMDLTRNEYKNLPKFNVGSIQGSKFTLEVNYGIFEVSSGVFKYILPITELVTQTKKLVSEQTIGRFKELYKNHEYKNKQAEVRVSTDLNTDEKNYLNLRTPKVKKALEKLLNMKLEDNEVLKIGFIASGGGYRALVSTLGSVIGANSFGLIDTATYFSTLSGSTWMLSMWTLMGNNPEEFRNKIIPKLKTSLVSGFSASELKELISYLFKKYVFNEPLSIIDLYGFFLAIKLLSGLDKNPLDITLSDQINRIKTGDWVFPIYTAVVTKTIPYEWFEFTPYEVGSTYMKGFVPTWAFGRKFSQGKSVDFAPSQSLGFFMGIWGSAISANVKEIYENLENSLPEPLKSAIKYGSEELSFGTKRVYPAKLFNYNYGLPKLPISQRETLTLVDAGVGCNLPVVPLLRPERKLDVLIIFDASQNVDAKSSQLKCVEDYARAQNIKFPKIDYTDIDKKPVSIFKDDTDSTVPTIIYLPRIKNPKYSKFDPTENINAGGYARTDNLAYTEQQVRELSGLTEFNIKENKDLIINTLKDLITSRRKIK